MLVASIWTLKIHTIVIFYAMHFMAVLEQRRQLKADLCHADCLDMSQTLNIAIGLPVMQDCKAVSCSCSILTVYCLACCVQ